MTIDVTQTITNLAGDPIQAGEDALTLRLVAINALLAKDERASGQAKVSRAKLAQKVRTEDELDLSENDMELLRKRIGDTETPLVVMRAWELLERE